MTDISQWIEPRAKSIDGFDARRVLPAAARRMVGPFIFFDHVGPSEVSATQVLDVRPHPHIHLATVTYLFEGEILHRDSLGNERVIAPGAINWMTAGRGIVHSERTPPDARRDGSRMHLLQLWVSLPKSHEEIEPSFVHHPADTLPELDADGVRLRVLAGQAYGLRSPVEVFSPLFYVEARLSPGARLKVLGGYRERAAYLIDGEVRVGGEPLRKNVMAVFDSAATPLLEATTQSTVMLLGGDPFDEPRHIFWNFASSSKERIQQAAEDWRAGRFPTVPGDDKEFIPLNEVPKF